MHKQTINSNRKRTTLSVLGVSRDNKRSLPGDLRVSDDQLKEGGPEKNKSQHLRLAISHTINVPFSMENTAKLRIFELLLF